MQPEEGFDSAVHHSNLLLLQYPRVCPCALGSTAQIPSHTMTSQALLSRAVNLSTVQGSYFKGHEVLVFSQVQAQGSPSDAMPGKGCKKIFGVTCPGQGEGAQAL